MDHATSPADRGTFPTENSTPRPALAELLGLAPHEEGGWYGQTWKTGRAVDYEPAGYSGPRAAASGIYYLLEAGEQSRWHAVTSDEVWLWHRGGPLRLAIAPPGPAPDLSRATLVDLGPDIESGQRPQYVVPAGHWQSAHPLADDHTLVSCVVAPSFHYDDFTILDNTPNTSVRAEARAVLPASPARLWPLISAFDDIATWHPLLARSTHESGPADVTRPGHIRSVTTTDGQTLTERLVSLDSEHMTCVYEFVTAPFPVSSYTSELRLEPGVDPDTTQAHWYADFTPTDPARTGELRTLFAEGVFAAGLDALSACVSAKGRTVG